MQPWLQEQVRGAAVGLMCVAPSVHPQLHVCMSMYRGIGTYGFELWLYGYRCFSPGVPAGDRQRQRQRKRCLDRLYPTVSLQLIPVTAESKMREKAFHLDAIDFIKGVVKSNPGKTIS